MPFEYGYTEPGAEKQLSGLINNSDWRAVVSYDYNGSCESITIIQPRTPVLAEVYEVAGDEIDIANTVIDDRVLTSNRKIAVITPDNPFETAVRSEAGDEALFYVNYIPMGSMVLHLATGR
jgi:hypothetical protein